MFSLGHERHDCLSTPNSSTSRAYEGGRSGKEDLRSRDREIVPLGVRVAVDERPLGVPGTVKETKSLAEVMVRREILQVIFGFCSTLVVIDGP